jgi:hypothetical protein
MAAITFDVQPDDLAALERAKMLLDGMTQGFTAERELYSASAPRVQRAVNREEALFAASRAVGAAIVGIREAGPTDDSEPPGGPKSKPGKPGKGGA